MRVSGGKAVRSVVTVCSFLLNHLYPVDKTSGYPDLVPDYSMFYSQGNCITQWVDSNGGKANSTLLL